MFLLWFGRNLCRKKSNISAKIIEIIIVIACIGIPIGLVASSFTEDKTFVHIVYILMSIVALIAPAFTREKPAKRVEKMTNPSVSSPKIVNNSALGAFVKRDRMKYEEAIDVLRQKIIRKLGDTKNRLATYELISLYGHDAANCFPSEGWALVHFSLDLNTLKISAYVATYPNQFGACIERILSVSSSEFHSIAERLNFPEELKAFETDKDWKKLFDTELNAAVERFEANIKHQIEERKKEKQKEKKQV